MVPVLSSLPKLPGTPIQNKRDLSWRSCPKSMTRKKCSYDFVFMACTSPSLFDVLRAKTEDLSPVLHHRASWRDVWLNLIPRDNYPQGAGYVRSSFHVARSEPSTDEETWVPLAPINADTNADGACGVTYNQTYVGEHEDQYRPENFGLMGPLVCQDEFTMKWQSQEFWMDYFSALEKRNMKSIINRAGNVYRQYAYKASARDDFGFVVGKWQGSQPPPSVVDMTDYTTGALGLPTSELTQEMLDGTAIELNEEGAQEGDTNGWITMDSGGPVYPLYIGQKMSNRLLLNNSELRNDFNSSFQGWGDENPVIQRLGAKRIIKNFRHIINLFPARWIYVPNGVTVNITSTGLKSNTGVTTTYANGTGTGVLKRIPTWANSTDSFDVTKGVAAVVNGVWRDPNPTVTVGDASQVAIYEGCEVLNPRVMTQEVLTPVNSMPGMKLTPQSYAGEWKFVTGNDALLGIDGCTGITDPTHTRGRHFGRFLTAWKPVLPIFGRFILFKLCPNAYDTITCS